MKFLHVCLLALVALLSVTLVAATEREVRSYTSEMEYVDHVALNSIGAEEQVGASPALMETASTDDAVNQATATPSAPVEHKMGFFMEDETSLLEAQAETEIDTDVMRQMALEIHDAAQANLNEEGEVVSFLESSADVDTDADVDAEGESYADSESDADADADSEFYAESDADADSDAYGESDAEFESEMDSEVDREVERDAIPTRSMAEIRNLAAVRNRRLDPNAGLTPAEVAQEVADNAASKRAAEEEKRDKVESAVDKVKAKEDAKILSQPLPVVPQASKESSSAAAAEIVRLPTDLSAEHGATLRANEAATATIGGALKEMDAILRSKDDTIRSLVYNISYLTVNIGKLANKLDESRNYIKSLETKLNLSRAKVHKLKGHVAHSKATASSIRAQLKAVEARLNGQDAKTAEVSAYLAKKVNTPNAKFNDNLKVVGKRVKSVSRRGRKLRSKLHPVAGTQTLADASVSFQANGVFPFPVDVQTFTPPAFAPVGGIPTIVIERADDGM